MRFLGELRAVGIDLYLHVQGLDTSTPPGRAMFQMLRVFSEFERAMIQERVKVGLAEARENGMNLGRWPVDPGVVRLIKNNLENGEYIHAMAKVFSVGHSIVQCASLGLRK